MKKICLLIFVFTLLFACEKQKKAIHSLDDLTNISIGAMTGSTGEALALARFPEAEVKSFDNIMDGIAALQSDQLEAIITAYPTAMNVCKHNSELSIIEEPVDYENTAMAVRKDSPELLAQLNKTILQFKDDGTLKDMKKRWLKSDLSPYVIPEIDVPTTGEVLKIGTSATREPFCFVDDKQNVSGHDGELSRRISKALNRPIEFHDMKFSALIPALKSGKVDVIIACMTATDERRKSVNFTESYFQNSQVIIVKNPKDSKQPVAKQKDSLQDYKDDKIGVLIGSVHDTFILENAPNAKVLQYKNPPEIMLAVKTGKVDVGVYTTETLKDIFKTEKEFELVGDTLFAVPVAMGFNKKNTKLRDQFNTFLEKIKSDGTYDDMVQRWITNGSSEMPKIPETSKNGDIIIGIVSDKGLPFTILQNNELIGFDIEMAKRFALYLGKKITFSDMEFGSLIISAATNKIDMITSTLMITDERKKQISFSDSYTRLGASLFRLKSNIPVTTNKMKVLDDIADKSVGVYSGTVHDDFVAKHYPDAEIKRFNTTSDIILALNTKKIDVAFFDLHSAQVIMKTNPQIGILTEDALDLPLGYGFNKKNTDLLNEFNAFLKDARTDGTFDKIYTRWFHEDPEKAVMPNVNFPKDGKPLTLGVAIGDLPYSSFINNEYVGFDIEMIQTFAVKNGYNLKIKTMDFSALVAASSAGKVDIIADGICITEERQKQIAFSDVYAYFKTGVIALNENLFVEETKDNQNNTDSSLTFLGGVGEGFYNNIIKENRYLLILDGLKTTILIAIFAILFGTTLGGFICFMRMSKHKFLQIPAKMFISILRGTPVLVVLMITFYVIFASVDINPIIVAVIAFGMNFGAYASEMFRTGIESIDKGQAEAGTALGFTRTSAFINIVLPQAIRRILPVYRGEIISLVKMTSIVGYIAVQDLTKASDIIRSRTFDAFFPLIMVAVLYYLISWLLMVFLSHLERATNPKNKRRG